MSEDRFIVAEVSKNWVRGNAVHQTKLISQMFEDIINHNHKRGYRLLTFDMCRLLNGKDELNETIVAVFERRDDA